MTTSIWWVRRDLRLMDNQALDGALAASNAVLPIFILDPSLLASPYTGHKRLAFLFEGLRKLDVDLRSRGSRLIVRQGDPAGVLRTLLSEAGASAIFAEEDVSPFARQRDKTVGEQLPLQLTAGLTVHPPEAIRKDDGGPYVVYTPFSKIWRAMPAPGPIDVLAAPERIVTPAGIPSLAIPDGPALPGSVPFPAGEVEAQRRLAAFTGDGAAGRAVYGYADRRNRPDLDGTSQLSPYFRFGMLSMRQAVAAARLAIQDAPDGESEKGASTWLNELIWREFYLSILYHFPHVRSRSFYERYDRIAWRNNPAEFRAWTTGKTGYPLVDAAMRQLAESGWMHNRARMVVASFLVKDLLIDWRWGERWFMQQLVDGDPAANNGGWQWAAGTGTDAAPYFRIFNPTLQSKKFDPHGDYIRRWLPELAGVPGKYIHEPWLMPAGVQSEANCRIGRDYPGPVVDHGRARERTLTAFKAIKDNA